MKKIILSSTASLALLLSFSLQSPAKGAVIVDRVVAVVNNEIITLSDLQREEALRKGSANTDERQLLEDMIDRKLQMDAAKRTGMDVTDKELADAIADIMKRNSLDAKQFEQALAKEGLTLEQYKTELREQMTLSRMVGKYVRSGIAVDDAEVRAYYERNRKSYTQPEELRLRQIYFPLPDNATPAQIADIKSEALAEYERAKKGEDFLQLVREHSQGADSPDGDLGFMERQNMQPEIEEATRGLKVGEIAGPILSSGGFHIIRLEEVRVQVKPFEKVKDEIMNTLYEQKMANSYRTWLQSLRSDANIENRLQ
ncbi:MAG TPA: peptidyl-prolyl cis-trans isomerase [Nitrospirota bacterium]|nr:peptidyl-prolyl cis-trans isomerase [Nitrospirota bacterium]